MYPENVVFLSKLQSVVLCCFFLKNKELLKFEPQMSFFIGQDFSAKRSVSVSYKSVSCVQHSPISLMVL